MYAKELESIQEFGFIDPITVMPDGGDYTIIDGEHRWRAAKDLGIVDVPIVTLDVTVGQAKKLTIVLNELKGQARPDLLGPLLVDLKDELGDDLLTALPYTPEILAGFIDLPSLPQLPGPSSAASAPAPGDPTRERWVERLYRMPESVAKVLDDAVAKAKADDEIDNWQALERIAADFLSGI